MRNRFILTEAEETERDSSDTEEAPASKEIPIEYSLPPADSSSYMELVVRHLEGTIQHRFQPFNRNSTIHVATSAPHYAGSSVTIDEHDQRATSIPPTDISQSSSSRPRRLTSVPPTRPVLEAKLPLMARRLSPTTRFAISDDMESPEASSRIFDAVLTREGELDWEKEDELESTDWPKSWIERNLGAGELQAPAFRIFYVRCEPQYERSIVDRIRADVEHGTIDDTIIRTAFPSASPGGIYLQVQSMLPQNTALASYLLTIPGLLYSASPRVVFPSSRSSSRIPTASARTDLTLPIHSAIEDIESIENIVREPSDLDRYPPHTWIKCKQGLYKDDVGLVVADHFDEIDYDVEQLVLVPPRIDCAEIPEISSGRMSLKRKRTAVRPEILPWKAVESIARTYCIPSQLECPQRCQDPDQCLHSEAAQKRYRCLDRHWQNGLVFIRVRLTDMEIASEILPDTRYYFLTSNHPDVQNSLLYMPPPSSWEFQIGEAVRFTDYDGSWCTPDGNYAFQLPEGRTEGVIFSVGSLNCDINIPLQGLDFTVHALHTMSKATEQQA
ncbi:hypothetical protein EV360DRAFT_86311 [Lentinula raphanica]|nr:hypothetical protein EV360DRAFT_86311 [Lentinula raphanica]